jgi:hypothetical protein
VQLSGAMPSFETLSVTVRERFGGPRNTRVMTYRVDGPASVGAGIVNAANSIMIGQDYASIDRWAYHRPDEPSGFTALLDAVAGSGLLELRESNAKASLPRPGWARIAIDDRAWTAPVDKLPNAFYDVFEAVHEYVGGLEEIDWYPKDVPLPFRPVSKIA